MLSLISSKSYPSFNTGSKRLFYSFRPPQEPHRVISIKNGWATVFIGDIHGCLDELKKLIEKVVTTLPPHLRDKFVIFFTGDLVNKGPHSSKTLKFVRRLVQGDKAHAVRGNHDEAMLNQYASYSFFNRLKHFFSFSQYHYLKFLTKEDIEFVSSLPYTITIPELKVILVHAGIDPNLSLIEQHPDNMVRMRNMVRGQPTHLIENGTQWAHVYQKSNKTSRIVFGHDARRRFQEDSKYIGLDTGAVYGDRLTALIHFPNSTETILSVDSKAYSPVRGEVIHTDS